MGLIITSNSLSLAGSDASFDLGATLQVASVPGPLYYLPGFYWPKQITVVASTGVAIAVALEYINQGLATPASTYDGIPSGSSLTSATETGAYLGDPTANAPLTIYVQPYSIQMKTNIKVHVFGASGTALITALR